MVIWFQISQELKSCISHQEIFKYAIPEIMYHQKKYLMKIIEFGSQVWIFKTNMSFIYPSRFESLRSPNSKFYGQIYSRAKRFYWIITYTFIKFDCVLLIIGCFETVLWRIVKVRVSKLKCSHILMVFLVWINFSLLILAKAVYDHS